MKNISSKSRYNFHANNSFDNSNLGYLILSCTNIFRLVYKETPHIKLSIVLEIIIANKKGMLKYVKEILMFQLYHVKHDNLIDIHIINMIDNGNLSQIKKKRLSVSRQIQHKK